MTNEPTRERIERAKKRAEDQVELYRRALIDHKQKRDRPCAMWLEGEYEADLKYIERRIENYETYLALLAALQAYRPVEVTDKDVAFAIEELEEVNNSLKLSRDGQKELGDEKEVSGFDDWIFANELAIKVLKTYRPEREACEWCRNVNNTHKMLFKMYGENYDPFLNRNGMSGNEHNVGYAYIDGCTIRYSAPQGEISWNLGIIYCPMCGRYLREAEESE